MSHITPPPFKPILLKSVPASTFEGQNSVDIVVPVFDRLVVRLSKLAYNHIGNDERILYFRIGTDIDVSGLFQYWTNNLGNSFSEGVLNAPIGKIQNNSLQFYGVLNGFVELSNVGGHNIDVRAKTHSLTFQNMHYYFARADYVSSFAAVPQTGNVTLTLKLESTAVFKNAGAGTGIEVWKI